MHLRGKMVGSMTGRSEVRIRSEQTKSRLRLALLAQQSCAWHAGLRKVVLTGVSIKLLGKTVMSHVQQICLM